VKNRQKTLPTFTVTGTHTLVWSGGLRRKIFLSAEKCSLSKSDVSVSASCLSLSVLPLFANEDVIWEEEGRRKKMKGLKGEKKLRRLRGACLTSSVCRLTLLSLHSKLLYMFATLHAAPGGEEPFGRGRKEREGGRGSFHEQVKGA